MKQVVSLGGTAYNKMTFKNVTVPEDGVYEMKLYYACGVERRIVYSVNGGEKVYHDCPSTGSYTVDSVESIYVNISLKEGENTIRLGNESAWCSNIASIGVSKTIIANDDTTVPSVSPSKINVKSKGYDLTAITLLVGKKAKLDTSVSPKAAEQKVIFSSSKKSVASVSSTGVVTAKKKGKTNITITTKDGKKKKTIPILVVDKKKANKTLALKQNKAVLKTKVQNVQIVIKKLTKNTTDTISYKVTSGKKYVRVDSYGNITVKKFVNGASAMITVRCGKISKTMKVILSK